MSEREWPPVKMERFISRTAPEWLGDPHIFDEDEPGGPEHRWETETYLPEQQARQAFEAELLNDEALEAACLAFEENRLKPTELAIRDALQAALAATSKERADAG